MNSHAYGWRKAGTREAAAATNLIHELRNADGVGCGAGTAQGKEGSGASVRIGHVVLVVWRVEVLAIPAAGSAVSICARECGLVEARGAHVGK